MIQATIYGLALGLVISLFLIPPVYKRFFTKKNKAKSFHMNCELVIRCVDNDIYRIEAHWCDTTNRAISTIQAPDPGKITLKNMVDICEATRILAEIKASEENTQ